MPISREKSIIGGRFHVQGHPQRGSYGIVYLCYDLEQDYFYALKTLNPLYLTNDFQRQRFRQEVDIWIGLEEHPNIVQCFALETIDNIPYILMEWVTDDDRHCRLYQQYHNNKPMFLDWYARLGEQGLELRRQHENRNTVSHGTTLESWIQWLKMSDEHFRLKFALEIVLDICAGLAYANRQSPGIVHRDLKPANILITQQQRAKITDFGLAIIIQETTGRVEGTPLYMAPEQWNGAELDRRTDIYALGCILHEILLGHSPFALDRDVLASQQQSSDLQQINAIRIAHEQKTPSSLGSEFPFELNDIVQICLQKDPADRFDNPDQLVEALTAVYKAQLQQLPYISSNTKPVTVESFNKVAYTYAGLQKFDEALANYSEAIRIDSSYPSTYINRGCTYYKMQRYTDSLADYAKAIRLGYAENNAKTFNNRGLIYTVLGYYEDALDDFRRAIEIDPDYANAFANRALLYVKIKQYKEALAEFNKAIQLNPDHAIAYNNRGYIWWQLQDLQKALNDYSQAIGINRTFAKAYANRSLIYQILNQRDDSLRDQEKARQRDPGIVHTHPIFVEPNQGLQDTLDIFHAVTEMSQPDPQLFLKPGGLKSKRVSDLVSASARRQLLEKAYDVFPEAPSSQMPGRLICSIKDVAFSTILHDTVVHRQRNGEIITQVLVKFHYFQGDRLLDPSPPQSECYILIDKEAQRQLEARGSRTIQDLVGSFVTLLSDNPDDTLRPYHIISIS